LKCSNSSSLLWLSFGTSSVAIWASAISTNRLKQRQIYLFKVLAVKVIVSHLSVAVNICLVSLGSEKSIFYFLSLRFITLLSRVTTTNLGCYLFWYIYWIFRSRENLQYSNRASIFVTLPGLQSSFRI
jgi:hypothetical protein